MTEHREMSEALSKVPDDPYGAFAWFVSHCSSGLYKELVAKGRTDTQARNAIVACFLDFASGEACRIARREGREPDHEKWRSATDAAFYRAVKRTADHVGDATEMVGGHDGEAATVPEVGSEQP